MLQSALSKNESATTVDADETFGESVGLQLKIFPTIKAFKAYAKMKI